MPDVAAAACGLCMGSGRCWFCLGDGEVRGKRCGECPPGVPGRCVRCLGSGFQPDGPEAA